jgi:citrate lyase subunit beta/citryl-CoA lyase
MIDGVAWMFCPADRSDRYLKAAERADVVILDLEDAVSPTDRPAARRALSDIPLDPARTAVRVNPFGTADQAADLAALRDTAYTTVMLAKTENDAHVRTLDGYDVVALCETPAGILHAEDIATAANTIALMWGAEDLVAALGGHSSRDTIGGYRDLARYARSHVLLAAGAQGKIAIDAVHLDIADLRGLAAEAEDAAASGFSAKACIHPSQVNAVRNAFSPTAEAVEWATRLLAAAADQPGVFGFEGTMVDEPVLRQARRIVAAAKHS